MKSIAVLFFWIGVAACSTDNWTDMRVTWSRDRTGINVTAFFDVPSTLSEAVAGPWQIVDVSNDLNLQGVGIEGDDFNFIPLYDCNGYLSGAQVSVSVAVVEQTGPANNTLASDVTQAIETVNGEPRYVTRFLLVDPDFLSCGECRTGLTNNVIGEGLWLRNVTTTSGYTKVPDVITEVLEDTLFTFQNCIPTMGTHYYYQQAETECEKFSPWALLGINNSVHGLAYQAFGNSTKLIEERNWYEPIDRSGVEFALPLINECLYDSSDTYGVISIHIFFIANPWNTTCNQETDSAVPITTPFT